MYRLIRSLPFYCAATNPTHRLPLDSVMGPIMSPMVDKGRLQGFQPLDKCQQQHGSSVYSSCWGQNAHRRNFRCCRASLLSISTSSSGMMQGSVENVSAHALFCTAISSPEIKQAANKTLLSRPRAPRVSVICRAAANLSGAEQIRPQTFAYSHFFARETATSKEGYAC